MKKITQTKHILNNYIMVFVLGGLFFFATLVSDTFLNVDNLVNIIRQVSVLGLVSLGITYIIVSGHMDLSVSAVMSFSGILVCSLQDKISIFPAIAVSLIAGVALGFVTGIIIVITKANAGGALMLTLGTQTLYRCFPLLYTGGYNLRIDGDSPFRVIGQGFIGGIIPVPAVIFIVCAVILNIILVRTRHGRSISLMGANQTAARFSGINISRYKVTCYMVSALCAALGAVVLSSRVMGTSPVSGTGYELDAIMAVVVGGTSLAGGKGNMINTVIGVLIVGVLRNSLSMIGFNSYQQLAVKGAIIILAVLVDTLKKRNQTF